MRHSDLPELTETYRTLAEQAVSCVVLGRPGVPAARTRPEADLTLLVGGDANEALDEALTGIGYARTTSRQRGYDEPARATIEHTYERVAGERTVTVDVLVGRIRCGPTGAEWDAGYVREYSEEQRLDADETVTLPVPEPALLATLELHSRNRDDGAGLAALAGEVDLSRIERHLYRGDPEALASQIEWYVQALADTSGDETPDPEVAEMCRFLWAILDEPSVNPETDETTDADPTSDDESDEPTEDSVTDESGERHELAGTTGTGDSDPDEPARSSTSGDGDEPTGSSVTGRPPGADDE